MVEKIRLNRYLVAHLNKNLTRLHPDTFASCEPLKIVTDNHNPNRAALFVTTVDFGKNQVLPQSLLQVCFDMDLAGSQVHGPHAPDLPRIDPGIILDRRDQTQILNKIRD